MSAFGWSALSSITPISLTREFNFPSFLVIPPQPHSLLLKDDAFFSFSYDFGIEKSCMARAILKAALKHVFEMLRNLSVFLSRPEAYDLHPKAGPFGKKPDPMYVVTARKKS